MRGSPNPRRRASRARGNAAAALRPRKRDVQRIWQHSWQHPGRTLRQCLPCPGCSDCWKTTGRTPDETATPRPPWPAGPNAIPFWIIDGYGGGVASKRGLPWGTGADQPEAVVRRAVLGEQVLRLRAGTRDQVVVQRDVPVVGALPDGWDADVLPVSFYFKPTQ